MILIDTIDKNTHFKYRLIKVWNGQKALIYYYFKVIRTYLQRYLQSVPNPTLASIPNPNSNPYFIYYHK